MESQNGNLVGARQLCTMLSALLLEFLLQLWFLGTNSIKIFKKMRALISSIFVQKLHKKQIISWSSELRENNRFAIFNGERNHDLPKWSKRFHDLALWKMVPHSEIRYIGVFRNICASLRYRFQFSVNSFYRCINDDFFTRVSI